MTEPDALGVNVPGGGAADGQPADGGPDEIRTLRADRHRLAGELRAALGELSAVRARLHDESAARAAAEGYAAGISKELDEVRMEVMTLATERVRPRGLFRRAREVAPIPPKLEEAPPAPRHRTPPPPASSDLESEVNRRLFR